MVYIITDNIFDILTSFSSLQLLPSEWSKFQSFVHSECNSGSIYISYSDILNIHVNFLPTVLFFRFYFVVC